MILTIGPGGCGFTFLNWSISYLRGDEYYTLLDGTRRAVPTNPLDGVTAHKSSKDHLKFKHSKKILDLASQQSIIYITPGSQEDFDILLEIPCKKIILNGSIRCKELMARAYLTMPDSDSEADSMIKMIDALGTQFGKSTSRRVLLDCANWFTNYYNMPDISRDDWLEINYTDIFDHLNQRMYSIFDFLKLRIDDQRWTSWLSVYDEYKNRNQGFVAEFLNDMDEMSPDLTCKKHILKEVLNWRSIHRHRINKN